MTNLLSANLLRLRKNVLFWGTTALSFGFAVYICVIRLREQSLYGYEVSLNSVFFGWSAFIGLVIAVFTPLFFGTEYSDGAIRNKISVGGDRTAIYLANFLTAFAAALVFSAAYMLSCVVVGLPLIGWMTVGNKAILICIFGSFAMIAAYCAIFSFVAMNCSRKSAAAVICMLGMLLLFVAAMTVEMRLEAQEFFPSYSLVDGEIVEDIVANPRYLQGTQREVYEFFADLLPAGQSIQYGNIAPAHPVRMVLCALGETALFTAAGAALFKRKDLK